MPRVKGNPYNDSVHPNSVLYKLRQDKGKEGKKELAAYLAWVQEIRGNETSYNKWHHQLWINNNPNQKAW
jgi:hypothetical protein